MDEDQNDDDLPQEPLLDFKPIPESRRYLLEVVDGDYILKRDSFEVAFNAAFDAAIDEIFGPQTREPDLLEEINLSEMQIPSRRQRPK